MIKISQEEALTFDDVLLKPCYSQVLPNQADTSIDLTPKIKLGIPLLSAAMDTVSEWQMCIALAQAGGIGVLHRNLSIDEQVDQVLKVKKFEAGMVINPITIRPENPLSDALHLMRTNAISGIPVTNKEGKFVGILTNRDVRFAADKSRTVAEYMTNTNLITVDNNVNYEEAKQLLHKHRIEKLVVTDQDQCCVGLITVKDIERSELYPHACKDEKGRLRVAAATSVGETGLKRAAELVKAGVDILVVDTAHGHSKGVIETVRQLRHKFDDICIIAGNIATAEAAQALIEAGADVLKVGIGPGSICTTRIVAGVGMPQLTAIMDVCDIANKHGITVIADGGIRYSGDLAKALAAGATAAMVGSLLAGTDEAPGEIFQYNNLTYKSYRGMGSLSAMSSGSADRYFQGDVKDDLKLVPEGVEARTPYKGPVQPILHQMVGGLKAAMGYTGCATITDMPKKCEFIRISSASWRESHIHGISVTKQAPNYQGEYV